MTIYLIESLNAAYNLLLYIEKYTTAGTVNTDSSTLINYIQQTITSINNIKQALNATSLFEVNVSETANRIQALHKYIQSLDLSALPEEYQQVQANLLAPDPTAQIPPSPATSSTISLQYAYNVVDQNRATFQGQIDPAVCFLPGSLIETLCRLVKQCWEKKKMKI